ncbi:transcriptional regulator [Brevibacillus borstelensis]|uniref:transcriptional regulator n=1 Tax=Brevibacillus borstelensis TaxID=45462 RepID=UPI002E1FBD01|nr:transcriptional regulator [Brevibacillus borstelensis]
MWLTIPVGEMAEQSSETMRISALIIGEMKPDDIPLAQGVDLQAIKSGDDDPMEVVVEIPAGKSTRGWNYLPQSLQAIVNHVQQHTLNGFLGHQKPEDVSNKFEEPVTHWVGSAWKDGKAYFRGVIDKKASDLKRWIRAKRIKQVSIFGIPKLEQKGGQTNVVDYKPLSIDWTPLDRSGMPTSIVAIGEMDQIVGEEPGGAKEMNWKELIDKLKALLASGEVTRAQILAAFGWKVQDVAGEMDQQWLQSLQGSQEMIQKVSQALNITGEMNDDAVTLIKEGAQALAEKKQNERSKLIESVVKEKVAGEMAQNLVLKMLHVPENATKDEIAGEVAKVIGDETVKSLIDRYYADNPLLSTNNGQQQPQGLRTKKVSI